ncbi:MAG: hypothetical protein IIZ48_07720 [Erysipelotrichales bacterium]|nr:hypothetical protein [Erysipelotrichales bacterium]
MMANWVINNIEKAIEAIADLSSIKVEGHWLILAGVVLFVILTSWFAFALNKAGYDSFDQKIIPGNEMIYFYTKHNKVVVFRYDECEEIGMSSSINPRDELMYACIYFSKVKLTKEQKEWIGWYNKTPAEEKKRGLKLPIINEEYIYVQYKPELFFDLKQCLPEPFRTNLIEDEKRCQDEYRAYLKKRTEYWSRESRTDI